MFAVIIPFVAQETATNWTDARHFLKKTITSVLSSKSNKIRAIVICQNDPKLEIYDYRYIFFKSSNPVPSKYSQSEKRHDKGSKIWEAFQFLKKTPPEYVMILDADDLISSFLVSYVYSRPSFDAFCFKWGYEWNIKSKYLVKRPYFNQYCGSSFVWKFDKRIFPSWIGGVNERYIADQSHSNVESAMDNEGLNVDKVNQPMIIYTIGHTNHLGYRKRWQRKLKDLVLWPLRSVRINSNIINEYSIYG